MWLWRARSATGEGHSQEYDDGHVVTTFSIGRDCEILISHILMNKVSARHQESDSRPPVGETLSSFLASPQPASALRTVGKFRNRPVVASGTLSRFTSLPAAVAHGSPSVAVKHLLQNFRAPPPISIKISCGIPSHESFRRPETRYHPVGNLVMNPSLVYRRGIQLAYFGCPAAVSSADEEYGSCRSPLRPSASTATIQQQHRVMREMRSARPVDASSYTYAVALAPSAGQ